MLIYSTKPLFGSFICFLRRYPVGGINQYSASEPGALHCQDVTEAVQSLCDYLIPCPYNIKQDPCEYQNIAPNRPELVELLRAKLKAYNATALPSFDLPMDPRATIAANERLYQTCDMDY